MTESSSSNIKSPDTPKVLIEEEMKSSYLDYAMSVIVSRALPDARDGLKPVHRRILFAMRENGYDSNKPYKKSARAVGEVMGKYHPHGDSAIYDAMVRMAQGFSMRLPLVDGQGNFGSMDGDPPAAMRYTEARLSPAAETLLEDIDQDTVDFRPNYDDSAEEPAVLPARFPNLLVNGAGGIAVGMATNIPPHNLGEVVDACLLLLDEPDAPVERIMEVLPGPDFPTGGLIVGRAGIRAAYATGRGGLTVQARVAEETLRQGRQALIVTEIPYQVNKSRLVSRIAEVVREKVVEGIAELRDESDRHGVRIVIALKREAEPGVTLAQLRRHTPLQTTFGVNALALDGGRPRLMALPEILRAFLTFRETVIVRRTAHQLRRARARAHVLGGLLVAIANLDPVIALIRAAPDPASARAALTGRRWPAGDVAPFITLADPEADSPVGADGTCRLSDAQAAAILELRLQRLTGLERDKLEAEARALAERIAAHMDILRNRPRRLDVMRGELRAVRDRFATPRRTDLEEAEHEHDLEDLIQREEMVLTVSHKGYIKRTSLSAYRAQRRGGKGRAGMATREDDLVTRIFVTSTHTTVLFFSTAGMVYQTKVYRLPLGAPQARGRAMVNLLPLAPGEGISAIMPLPEDEADWDRLFVMFATASGRVRRNRLSDFTGIKANGKIAMKLDAGDRLVSARVCDEGQDVLLATAGGMAIRFPARDVRVFSGRSSTGVRGIRLAAGDSVMSMTMPAHSAHTPEERRAYLQAAAARRRLESGGGDAARDPEAVRRDRARAAMLDTPAFQAMAAAEQHALTVGSGGAGQLCSLYEYRVTGRGGLGIANMDLDGARAVGAFLVDPAADELMLVTDGGQVIRAPARDIRAVSRNSKGVRLLNVAAGQSVVSVARLRDVDDADADEDAPEDVPEDVPENAPEDAGNGSGAGESNP